MNPEILCSSLEKYQNETDFHRLALKLSKQTPDHEAIVETLYLRNKAQEKYTHAKDMLFTRQAFEQSSSDSVAKYVAKRFEGKQEIYDLTAGLGTMSFHLAHYGNVTSIEKNQDLQEITKHNQTHYNPKHAIQYITGDCMEHLPKKCDAIYIDPSRRNNHFRSISLKNTEPNIIEIFETLKAVTPNIAVKVSPAFDMRELYEFPEMPEVEMIYWNGSLREAILWFGDFKTCEHRGTLLPQEISHINNAYIPEMVEQIEGYLHDPLSCFSRGKVLGSVMEKHDVCLLSLKSHYLVSKEKKVLDECKTYVIKEVMEFSKVKKYLKQANITAAVLKQRGTELELEKVRKKLKIKESQEWYVFFAIWKGDLMGIVCQLV